MRKWVGLFLVFCLFLAGCANEPAPSATEAPAVETQAPAADPQGNAPPEASLSTGNIQLRFPEDWTSTALGEGAAEMGVLYSAASPGGGITLQVLRSQGATLAETSALLSSLSTVTGFQERASAKFSYISYQIDNMYCYVVQVAEREAVVLNFALTDPHQLDQIDTIAQEIISSIPLDSPEA